MKNLKQIKEEILLKYDRISDIGISEMRRKIIKEFIKNTIDQISGETYKAIVPTILPSIEFQKENQKAEGYSVAIESINSNYKKFKEKE